MYQQNIAPPTPPTTPTPPSVVVRPSAAGGLQPERPRGPLRIRGGGPGGRGEDADGTVARGRRRARDRRPGADRRGGSSRRSSGGGAEAARGGLPRGQARGAPPRRRVPGRHRGRSGVLVSVRRPGRVPREDLRALGRDQVDGQVAVLAGRVPDRRLRLHDKSLGRRHVPKAGDNRERRETGRKGRLESHRTHGHRVSRR